ncbi:basic salivary proline-rich protein 2-like [Homarus americanus]|uniref:basic salivary proline-rich protein 2-like n=1 Tax=Homarus americanus TaxID=6706 RepID=UPI001C43A1DF|nr:basic salivary proline-rich protein 2-like [Homarus americanus]
MFGSIPRGPSRDGGNNRDPSKGGSAPRGPPRGGGASRGPFRGGGASRSSTGTAMTPGFPFWGFSRCRCAHKGPPRGGGAVRVPSRGVVIHRGPPSSDGGPPRGGNDSKCPPGQLSVLNRGGAQGPGSGWPRQGFPEQPALREPQNLLLGEPSKIILV